MTNEMKLTTVQKAFLAIIIANIIWGAASPIFKLSLQNIPPFTLAFWRFFLGALLLLVILGRKVKLSSNTASDMRYLLGYAITGITLNIMFYFWGLQRTASINAPVIISSSPILTYFLALFFLREKANLRKLFGMFVGFAGILLIILEPLMKEGMDTSLVGNLCLVIATLAAVVQTIIGKKILSKFNPFAFTCWAFLIGSASFLPLAFWEYAYNVNIYSVLDWRGIMGIIYGAAFSSAAAYGLFAWGLSKIQATDASLFSYIDPVIGAILAYFMLHEPITTNLIIGSIGIFGGIFIAEGRINYHPILTFFHLKDVSLEPKVTIIHASIHPSVTASHRKEVLSKLFSKRTEEK